MTSFPAVMRGFFNEIVIAVRLSDFVTVTLCCFLEDLCNFSLSVIAEEIFQMIENYF